MDSTLLQCHEEAALGEDTKVILGLVVGPIKVDEKAIWHNKALKIYPMVLFIARINQFLKNAGETCLVDGAVNEK